MKTTSITIERNFHIMNDDRFIMEKQSITIGLDEGELPFDAINYGRSTLIQNFMEQYPHIETHLNFHVVRQSNGSDKELMKYASKISINAANQQVQSEAIPKGTIEEQNEYKYPVATIETIKKEIANYKLSASIFKAVYELQVKGNPELELLYNEKLKELEKLQNNKQTV